MRLLTWITIFLIFFSFIVTASTSSGLDNLDGFEVKQFQWTIIENSEESFHMGLAKGDIFLKFNKNSFSFQYLTGNDRSGEKSKFAYKMVGIDENWLFEDTGVILTYGDIESGEYVFRVKSRTDTVRGISIKITVLPSGLNIPLVILLVSFLLVVAVVLFILWHHYLQKIKIREFNVIKETERRAAEAELRANVARSQTQVVSEESKQKSIELQEARNFQLSMLPQSVPDLPDMDIAVSMKTATEVGGDYYDFKLTEDGVLCVVCGDATGHGLKAGTMLSVIKTIFVSDLFGIHEDSNRFFNRCSNTIKKVGLKNLHMALTVLRIKNYKLTVSSAGMPPVFIFRKENNVVERVLLKGPPLGAIKKFDYRCDYISVEPGDAVLLLTDGLPELFNRDKNMFGYDRVEQTLKETGENTAEEIVSYLNKSAEKWLNYKSQDDDMTFVVIKFK